MFRESNLSHYLEYFPLHMLESAGLDEASVLRGDLQSRAASAELDTERDGHGTCGSRPSVAAGHRMTSTDDVPVLTDNVRRRFFQTK
eukprot:4170170-Prymnesium_polylepis.2